MIRLACARDAGGLYRKSPRGVRRMNPNGCGCWRRSKSERHSMTKSEQRTTMNELRIVSFLPSATELACSLGLADQLVGISHECDFPPNIRDKPVVVHSALPIDSMSLGEIDVAVSQQLRSGASLYEVDEQLLRELAPTHILTQNLCQVCAPSGNEITE